ncbi:MAG: N-acyl homoserine lactonase family protein [Steroidobacteraceae bacterium]
MQAERNGKLTGEAQRAAAGTALASPPAPFEVYAIRYATVERRGAENFIGGDPHESASRMDYFVWLARRGAETYLIDTGFNEAAARRRKREFLRSPLAGLAALGVSGSAVTEVILTHLHYDHVGNFDLFPEARFHLQDRELAYATGRHMGTKFFSAAYEVDEVTAMVRNVYDGRVRFHAGDTELAPGLSVHLIGGHTQGLQVVRLWTRVGWLVLASDASHYTANRELASPFPVVADVTAMVEGWRRLEELASAPRFIVPGHDPAVMRQYRAPAAALEDVAVRLDAEPELESLARPRAGRRSAAAQRRSRRAR